VNAPTAAAAGTLAIAKAPVVSINAVLVEHVEFIPDPVHDGPHDLIAVQDLVFRVLFVFVITDQTTRLPRTLCVRME